MEKTAKNRGGGGGKLNRSETVTIRLDPKLRYLTELAARKHRRTVSSFIEWAIERALDDIVLRQGTEETTLGREAEVLWDTDEADRLAKLGQKYPELLTHYEQVLWKLIRENPLFWDVRGADPDDRFWHLNFESLRDCWDALNRVASGEADKSILEEWDKMAMSRVASGEADKSILQPPQSAPTLEDDDIPF